MSEFEPNASNQRGGFAESIPIIPEHRLIRVIGRGSYGEVWLAQNVLGVYRAVKIVTRVQFQSSKPFEREFSGIQKFEPLSRSHPGFVPILQVGAGPGNSYFYYVMELADDVSGVAQIPPDLYSPRTLSSAGNVRMSISECIRIGIALGESLQFLHNNGLVHRDVKPSNILFIDRNPKLADIGMVASLNEKLSFVGTEGFIPPEGPGSVQADIYGLGKLLYELCTGKDRLEFPSFPEQEGFADWSEFLELNEVLLKACQKRELRYRSAHEMVADLKALSVGKSVIRLHRLERQLANLKRIGGITAVFGIVVALFLVPIYREYRVRSAERQQEVGRNVANGVQQMEKGEYYSALPPLLRGFELDEASRKRTHLVRLNSVLDQSPKLIWMIVENTAVLHVQFSANGKFLLTTTIGGLATIYDLATGGIVTQVKHEALKQACFSPHEDEFLTAGRDQRIRLWDFKGNLLKTLTNNAQVYAACFSPSGKLIATGDDGGKAIIWDLKRGLPLWTLSHEGIVHAVQFSPDEKLLITGSQDFTSCIWNTKTGQRVQGPFPHQSWVYCVTFRPDGQGIATASLDGNVRIRSLATGYETIAPLRHFEGVRSISFSADGQLLLTGSDDRNAHLWNAETGEPVSPTFSQSGRVMDAQFSPDCRFIAVGCWDGSIRIYDRASVQSGISRGIAKATQDLRILAQTQNDTAIFKDISSGELIRKILLPERSECLGLRAYPGGVLGLFEGMDAKYFVNVPSGSIVPLKLAGKILSFDTDGKLIVFRTETNISLVNIDGKGLGQIAAPHAENSFVTLNVKDQTLVSCSDSQMDVWRITNGLHKAWTAHRDAPISSVEFSPNGQWAVVAERDYGLSERTAVVLSLTDGHPQGAPLMHRDGVIYAGFNADGTKIVTSSEDLRASIWDSSTGKLLAGPLRHPKHVEFASFSSNGLWVVTASQDCSARVWDAITGEALTPPLWHSKAVERAVFLNNDTVLATQTESGEIFVWKLDDEIGVIKKLPAFIALTSGDGLSNWQGNWNDLNRFHLTRISEEAAIKWHRNQAQACSALKNKLGQRLHEKYAAELLSH